MDRIIWMLIGVILTIVFFIKVKDKNQNEDMVNKDDDDDDFNGWVG